MCEIIPKLRKGNIHLMYVIIFCSVFTRENAFSRKHFEKEDLKVTYNSETGIITFDLLFYDYVRESDEHGFLEKVTISYCKNGNTYTNLFKASSTDQKGKSLLPIKLWYKKYEEKIQVIDRNKSDIYFHIWPDLQVLDINAKAKKRRYRVGQNSLISERCSLRFKWYLPQSLIRIKTIKISGFWKINDKRGGDLIEDIYPFEIENLISCALKHTPSVSKTGTGNNVKVTKSTDEINMAGVKPGETIEVCNIDGKVVKSVVAIDNVVNIKLPKNHIYIVNTGQASYKVALCVP